MIYVVTGIRGVIATWTSRPAMLVWLQQASPTLLKHINVWYCYNGFKKELPIRLNLRELLNEASSRRRI